MYCLGYVLLEQLDIATDIHFHVFNFQICLPWLFTKKAYSAHTIELMVAMWLVTSYIATDIQFHVFNFQICLSWLFTKKSL